LAAFGSCDSSRCLDGLIANQVHAASQCCAVFEQLAPVLAVAESELDLDAMLAELGGNERDLARCVVAEFCQGFLRHLVSPLIARSAAMRTASWWLARQRALGRGLCRGDGLVWPAVGRWRVNVRRSDAVARRCVARAAM